MSYDSTNKITTFSPLLDDGQETDYIIRATSTNFPLNTYDLTFKTINPPAPAEPVTGVVCEGIDVSSPPHVLSIEETNENQIESTLSLTY